MFSQGFAKETRDPAIVAATMAKPGVVLKRPVGSNGPFTEHAELPKDLPVEKLKERPAKPHKEPPSPKTDTKAARSAALAFAREQKRREMKRREAAREKERKRREQAIAKAGKALEQAKQEHETKVQEIEKDRAALTNGRKWRMRDGRSRRRSWRQLCVERVTTGAPTGRHQQGQSSRG